MGKFVNLAVVVLNWFLLRSTMPSPSSFNFLTFAPAFSILSILYLELAPQYTPQAAHPFALLAVEATNAIFYFAGFIALAIFLSKLVFCNGAVCEVGRATSVVAAAEFASWIATTILRAKSIFKSKGSRQQSDNETPMGQVTR